MCTSDSRPGAAPGATIAHPAAIVAARAAIAAVSISRSRHSSSRLARAIAFAEAVGTDDAALFGHHFAGSVAGDAAAAIHMADIDGVYRAICAPAIVCCIELTLDTSTSGRRAALLLLAIGRQSDMARWINDWNPEDERFWEARGKRIARATWSGRSSAENIGFSVWLMWSVVGDAACRASASTTRTDQLFSLVAVPGSSARSCASRTPSRCRVRRPQLDGRQRAAAVHPDAALVVLVKRPDTPFWLMALAAATRGPRRRQLRLEHGQHLVLLSRSREGLRARAQRRRRQHRRQHGAAPGAASSLSCG